MLYSFDVFDTVITRKTATPQGIFKQMQKTLLEEDAYGAIPEYVRRNFCALRPRIERLMRINDCYRGVEDITLARIYEGFAETGYTDKEQAGRLKELEEQVELANVLGLSKAIAAVKELLRRGQRVAFISDMYLAKETIRRMLAAADPELAQIPLYVSGACTIWCGKRSRRSFPAGSIRGTTSVPMWRFPKAWGSRPSLLSSRDIGK